MAKKTEKRVKVRDNTKTKKADPIEEKLSGSKVEEIKALLAEIPESERKSLARELGLAAKHNGKSKRTEFMKHVNEAAPCTMEFLKAVAPMIPGGFRMELSRDPDGQFSAMVSRARRPNGPRKQKTDA